MQQQFSPLLRWFSAWKMRISKAFFEVFFVKKYVQQQQSSSSKNLLGLVFTLLGGRGGCAKETAPVINIEINGVRGIWLTFLEWDIFLKKNWTDILYQTFRTNICCQIISWVSTSKLKSKCAIILLSKYLCWKVYLRKCKNTYTILQIFTFTKIVLERRYL